MFNLSRKHVYSIYLLDGRKRVLVYSTCVREDAEAQLSIFRMTGRTYEMD